MYDWTDYYLNRTIKNWVAHHQLPNSGKEQLLRIAQSPPVQRVRRINHILNIVRSTFSTQSIYFNNKSGEFEPYSQASLWPFHFATYWHLAH